MATKNSDILSVLGRVEMWVSTRAGVQPGEDTSEFLATGIVLACELCAWDDAQWELITPYNMESVYDMLKWLQSEYPTVPRFKELCARLIKELLRRRKGAWHTSGIVTGLTRRLLRCITPQNLGMRWVSTCDEAIRTLKHVADGFVHNDEVMTFVKEELHNLLKHRCGLAKRDDPRADPTAYDALVIHFGLQELVPLCQPEDD